MSAEIFDIKPGELSRRGWAFHGEEIKYTSSQEIIKEELQKLIDQRIFVELGYGSFSSSPTVLVAYSTKGGLEFDMPHLWNDELERIFIRYRLPGMPYHYFRTRVTGQDPASVRTAFPDLLAVLERRQFFRVEVPVGSAALVQKKRKSPLPGGKRRKASGYVGMVQDISLGGARLFFDARKVANPPPLRSIVGPVIFRMKITGDKLWGDIEIPEAEVVRLRETKIDDRLIWDMGLNFHLPESKRQALYAYIRAREKEMMKTAG